MGMKTDLARLEAFLEDMARKASPGDRLPTVRSLMSQFSLSQTAVQKVTERLKAEGRISAETGRGTFFVGGVDRVDRSEGPDTAVRGSEGRSFLLLRRSTSIRRGRAVLELLQDKLQAAGHSVVEVSYTDSRDGLRVLRNLPGFDGCILQSSFETISIEMLQAIKLKTSAIVVDGAVLAGTEVDAVGVEWGTSIGRAIANLQSRGHERIGLVTTSHFLLATELGKIRFLELCDGEAGRLLEIPAWPHEKYLELAIERIAASRNADSSLPWTALIVWGVESGLRFREGLAAHGIEIPRDLSVILLGRTDLSNEHANFFEVIGPSVTQQAQSMLDVLLERLGNPGRPYRTTYLAVTSQEGRSVGTCVPPKP